MPTARIPPAALHRLASYEDNGVLHHVVPFGVAVERDNGWEVRGIATRIAEVDAVHVVATGASPAADFGPVVVIGGRHRGKLGYFDDEEPSGELAVVYFGEPFVEDYELVQRRHLVSVDITLMSLERYRRDAPDLYAVMGLPSRPDSETAPESTS